jgi:aspartyl protease family protein
MIVPVTLNRTLTANLLLDTGASMTMISRRIASSLALYPTRSGLISGIGGRVVAQIVRLDSIKVGDAEVNGMSISIHEISVNPQFDGLLGMDFLGRFQLSMDPAKSALILSPRESATPIP